VLSHATEDRPYVGCFIAAILSQRGDRFTQIGFRLAKRMSELLVEHLNSIAQNMDADALANERAFKQMPDPFVLWTMFQGFISQEFQSLEDGLAHFKCESNKKRILEDTCRRIHKLSFRFGRGQGENTKLPTRCLIAETLRALSKPICAG
jgi:hypothetical protein